MTNEFAQRLLKRPSKLRWCKANTPRGKLVAGVLVAINGDIGIVRRDDGGKDFHVPLSSIEYR